MFLSCSDHENQSLYNHFQVHAVSCLTARCEFQMHRVLNTIVTLLMVVQLGMGCCCWHHGADALDGCQLDSSCHRDICRHATDDHAQAPSFCLNRYDGADFHYGRGHGRCTFVKNSSFERMLVEMGQAGFCQGWLLSGQSGSVQDGCGFRPIPLLWTTPLRIHLLNSVMLL